MDALGSFSNAALSSLLHRTGRHSSIEQWTLAAQTTARPSNRPSNSSTVTIWNFGRATAVLRDLMANRSKADFMRLVNIAVGPVFKWPLIAISRLSPPSPRQFRRLRVLRSCLPQTAEKRDAAAPFQADRIPSRPYRIFWSRGQRESRSASTWSGARCSA